MSDWNSIQNAESVFINSILLSLPELTNEVVTVGEKQKEKKERQEKEQEKDDKISNTGTADGKSYDNDDKSQNVNDTRTVIRIDSLKDSDDDVNDTRMVIRIDSLKDGDDEI